MSMTATYSLHSGPVVSHTVCVTVLRTRYVTLFFNSIIILISKMSSN